MTNKNPPAAFFLFQQVRVETTLVDPTRSTDAMDAYYSFVGILMDVDDRYITLGFEKEDDLIPSTAIRHDDVRLIQIYTEEPEAHIPNSSVN